MATPLLPWEVISRGNKDKRPFLLSFRTARLGSKRGQGHIVILQARCYFPNVQRVIICWALDMAILPDRDVSSAGQVVLVRIMLKQTATDQAWVKGSQAKRRVASSFDGHWLLSRTGCSFDAVRRKWKLTFYSIVQSNVSFRPQNQEEQTVTRVWFTWETIIITDWYDLGFYF